MRGVLIGGLILGGLLAGGPVHAGVYTTLEQPSLPLPTDLKTVKFILGDLRMIDDRAQNPEKPAPSNSPHEVYKRAVGDLRAKEKRNGGLDKFDLIDLSGCLIRLGKFSEAQEILEPFLRQLDEKDPARFLLLLNQAAAYHGMELMDRAINSQEEALKVWPDVWCGWGGDQNVWYRRCERYYLKLLQLRDRENKVRPGAPWDQVDNLFPGIRFVGRGGKYEAGAIDPRMEDELPLGAHMVVLQLLLWLPADSRLYWLFGELLNARGDVVSAYSILDELVSARNLGNVQELFQHRRALRQPAEEARKVQEALERAPPNPRVQGALFWAALPRSTLAPGLGNAANEAAHFITNLHEVKQTPPPPAPLLEWRQIIVSFVAGALVALLVVLQVREWRRRVYSAPAEIEQPEREEPAPSG
jgi:hypothetical protein